jgi:hypothetical protein
MTLIKKEDKISVGNSWQGLQIAPWYWTSRLLKMKPLGTNQCINNLRHEAANTWPAVGNSCKRKWGMQPTLSEGLLGCRRARGYAAEPNTGCRVWNVSSLCYDVTNPLPYHSAPLEHTYIPTYKRIPISTGTGIWVVGRKHTNANEVIKFKE